MPDLEYLLAQARRIQEHREANAEVGIRKAFKGLLKNLQGFLGVEYANNAENGELSYATLQKKARYARFLSEVEDKVIKGTAEHNKIIKDTVNNTYKAAFNGMIDAVKKTDGKSKELKKVFESVKYVRPETLKDAVNNPVSGLTLNDNLEKNRAEMVYNIKQTIGIGLQNGDRYETMAKRVAESLDNDYNKAIRIVRTETHRVQQSGKLESIIELDKKLQQGNSGMRYFKTWKTAKDERVRRPKGKNKANHQKMEGVEILCDEYFDLGHGIKTMAPGQSGNAADDINCRCRLSFRLKKVEDTHNEVNKMSSLSEDWSKTTPVVHSKEENQALMEYASNKNINLYNIKKFDGDSELLKEQIDVLSSTLKEFKITDKTTVTFADLGDDDFAQTVNNTITFNNKVLRNKEITNKVLNDDNYLASTDISGIAIHEAGHIISRKYGEKGIEIAKKAYYNIYKEEISDKDIVNYLRKNISDYSSDIDERFLNRPIKSKYFKEIVPEILAKDLTNPNEFTNEFVSILKEVIL